MKGIHRPGSVRARITGFLGSALVLGALATVAAPATFAATPTSSCSWGDVTFTIDTVNKPYLVTHEATISVPPGGTYSQTTTMGKVASITASVSGTVSGTVEANAVLTKASASASLTLQASGTATVSSSVSYSWSFTNTSGSQHRYVVYTSPHRVSGNFTKYQCTRWETWTSAGTGTYLSFDYEVKGAAACWLTYAAGTDEKLAQAYC